jgi:uroporphyrinogen-III synthase
MQHINKICILSTGQLTRELVETIEEKGFEIDVMPFIKIEPLHSNQISKSIIDLSLRPATVVFTSINAAEKVMKELNGAKPLWSIFCIGHATRETLARYFGTEKISGVGDNASDLAKSILANNNSIKELIFFCGDQRRDELPVILSASELKVHEIIVYKTIPIHNKISKEYHGILFFSPSAVTAFFQDNSIQTGTILFAIGNTTAEAIMQCSSNTIVISDTPAKQNLLNIMSSYFDEKQKKIFN